MKKSLLLLLVLFLVGCAAGAPGEVSSELPQSSAASAVSVSAAAENDPLPEYMTRLDICPKIISEPFVDNITEDMINERLFWELIYQYNNMIHGYEVGPAGSVPYSQALNYMAFYSSHTYGSEEYKLRTPQFDEHADDYMRHKVDSNVVDNYLCSIFNTKVDRSKLKDPTVDLDFEAYAGYIPSEDCYLIRFRPSFFNTDVIIHSIEKGEDGVYTIHADYKYSFADEVDGELIDYSYPIYEQIFKIRIKDGSFKYLSVDYLKIYRQEK